MEEEHAMTRKIDGNMQGEHWKLVRGMYYIVRASRVVSGKLYCREE